MIFQRNPPKHPYEFCGRELDCVTSHPYLGVHISNTLSWNIHTQEVVSKAQRTLNVVRRNLWSCDRKTKATAYLMLVRPLLEYAAAAWDPSTKLNIQSLERVQRQAARFCTGNYRREEGSVSKALSDLGWQSLQTRRRNQRLCMLYKMNNGLVNVQINEYIQRNTRSTRGNNQKFHQVRHKARVFKDSFFVNTVKDWNNLPSSIVNSPSLETFKAKLNQLQ